ncbi:hypothetical protein NC651_017036 [Populus alba x Populus x berolinensis]|nr:hypothetical protein NC651_017036 [Populus alba x Populus x berolinensis]
MEKRENSRAVCVSTLEKRGSCPKGTIPIRRIRRRELLRTNGRKSPEHLKGTDKTAYPGSASLRLNNSQRPKSLSYSRKSFCKRPFKTHELDGFMLPEFTTAQIWLKSGAVNNFESVEAGWTVHPAEYSDARTRFFVYWTVDGYKKTGCFDLTCYGFVQTSTEIALGGAVEPDPTTTNWWLVFHDIAVGYWPGSLFSLLKHSATSVEWGGQVYSVNVRKTPHTKTAMGSGNDAEELYGFACFIGQPRILDYSKSYKYPTFVAVWKDEYNCYSAVNYKAGNCK